MSEATQVPRFPRGEAADTCPPASHWARRGATDIAPILIGVLPFATIAGAAAAAVGATPLQSLAWSALVFAGTAELAGLELIAAGAPLAVVAVTAMVINLRFAMYSASLAQHVRAMPRNVRALLAYFVTDQAYAVSMVRFGDLAHPPDRAAYFFGAAVPMWASWQAGHAAGYFLGARVPPSWSLDFSVPLVLMALLVVGLRDRVGRWVALATAAAVPLTRLLPLGLGVLAAIAVGVLVGTAIERRSA